jgi:hypothetical protein
MATKKRAASKSNLQRGEEPPIIITGGGGRRVVARSGSVITIGFKKGGNDQAETPDHDSTKTIQGVKVKIQGKGGGQTKTYTVDFSGFAEYEIDIRFRKNASLRSSSARASVSSNFDESAPSTAAGKRRGGSKKSRR